MNWPWQHLHELRTTQGRLGVAGLLPVRLADGRSIGAVAGCHGGLTALLALRGRRLWLDEPVTVTEAVAEFAAALSGPAVQVLVRRRRMDGAGRTAGWHALLEAGIADPSRRLAAERDYASSASPRLWDQGLGEVTAVVAVSAASPAALSSQVGQLEGGLPGGARPLGLLELAGWLHDWAGGDEQPAAIDPRTPTAVDALAPASLAFADDGVSLPGDHRVCFWRIVGLPEEVELGWIRHVLAEPALGGLAWDLSLHCRPIADPSAERQATGRALRAVEARLARWQRDGRRPAHRQVAGLTEERAELTRRLAALGAAGQALRQVDLWLAVHDADDQAATHLASVFMRLGWELAPVQGRRAVERAWRATGPLNDVGCQDDTPLLLPVEEVAPLAWWAVVPDSPPAGWPVLATTAERTAYLGPAAPACTSHLVATGADPSDARLILQGWALALAWGGTRVVVLEAGEQWGRLAEAVGGRAGWLGPGGRHGLDPVAGAGYRLDERDDWLAWLNEAAAFVARLLPPARAMEQDSVRSALLGLGLEWLEQRRPLGLVRLRDELDRGGHAALAGAIDHALGGRWRWLLNAPFALDDDPGLTVLSWAGSHHEDWPAVAGALLRRLWHDRCRRPSALRPPMLLVVDGDSTLLDDHGTAAALVEIAQAGWAAGLRLWLAAGPVAGLARSLPGRLVLVNAADRLACAEPSAALTDLVDVAGLPPAAARLVPVLPAGAGVVRCDGELAVVRSVLSAVIQGVLARGRSSVWPLTVVTA